MLPEPVTAVSALFLHNYCRVLLALQFSTISKAHCKANFGHRRRLCCSSTIYSNCSSITESKVSVCGSGNGNQHAALVAAS